MEQKINRMKELITILNSSMIRRNYHGREKENWFLYSMQKRNGIYPAKKKY